MTPREFLEQVVRPNLDEFHADFINPRRAHNAVASVDALAAHIFYARKSHFTHLKSDNDYRNFLAGKDASFSLLHDVAKANKHVQLIHGKPAILSVSQISPRKVGYGEGAYGAGRYGAEQIVVDIAPGDFVYIETVLNKSVVFLESEMAALGL